MKNIIRDATRFEVESYGTNEETMELVKKIMKDCKESGLSYKEINKALHLTDIGLYDMLINSPQKL